MNKALLKVWAALDLVDQATAFFEKDCRHDVSARLVNAGAALAEALSIAPKELKTPKAGDVLMFRK